MYLPIRHDGNIPSSFQKLQLLSCRSSPLLPSEISYQDSALVLGSLSIKSEVNLLELLLRGGPHREGVPFERNRPFLSRSDSARQSEGRLRGRSP